MSYNAQPPNYGQGYGNFSSPKQPHPKATTVLILGVLSLVCCGLLGPFAWVMGNNAYADVKRGMYAEDVSLQIGRILGIIASVLLVIGFVLFVILVALGTAPLMA